MTIPENWALQTNERLINNKYLHNFTFMEQELSCHFQVAP